MTKTMNERFEERFTYRESGFMGTEDYLSLIGDLKIDDLKSFIQSEIDIAVAEERKRIVEEIEKIDIPRNMYYKKIIDNIIYLITNK